MTERRDTVRKARQLADEERQQARTHERDAPRYLAEARIAEHAVTEELARDCRIKARALEVYAAVLEAGPARAWERG